MEARVITKDRFSALRGLSRAETWALESEKVRERPNRMEATFYASAGYDALNAMRRSGFQIETIGDRAAVWWFGPFARRYVDDPSHGLPFLSSSHMMEAHPRNFPIISHKHTPNLERYIVRDGFILVSCSGTIGNVALVTTDMDGWAVSQHAIRIIAHDPDDLGPIYCYLQSPLGQFLVKRSMSGSVVSSIYADDVASLPIPRLPRRLRSELTERIRNLSTLRVEANHLLNEAEGMINKLTANSFDELKVLNKFVTADICVKDLKSSGDYKGNLRLDANPLNPRVQSIREHLRSSRSRPLRSLVNRVIYIGKVYRIPIEDPDYARPLLSGKDLIRLRPGEAKLLSVLNKAHIERCLLHHGWILITRSGTLGRVLLVHKSYEGYIGSEDILRIIPNQNMLDPFYLSAFLGSEIGQLLIHSLTYGSVIHHLSKEQLESVPILVPKDRGKLIGELVKNAYEKRSTALEIENACIELLISVLRDGHKTTEAKWGKEY